MYRPRSIPCTFILGRVERPLLNRLIAGRRASTRTFSASCPMTRVTHPSLPIVRVGTRLLRPQGRSHSAVLAEYIQGNRGRNQRVQAACTWVRSVDLLSARDRWSDSLCGGRHLTSWARQGVLLLNTCLTVRAHEVGRLEILYWLCRLTQFALGRPHHIARRDGRHSPRPF